ncbi:hypothetical protein Tco_1259745, partial [Tanacetum coccineum]
CVHYKGQESFCSNHVVHKGYEDESAKKSELQRTIEIVTKFVEVSRRVGTDRHEEHQQQQYSGDVNGNKNVIDRLRTHLARGLEA